MILILGGTTEGRMAVKVADEAGSPYYYSTKGELQEIVCHNGTHITGGMDAAGMTEFCCNYGIKLLVDAAHPFATGVHSSVAQTAAGLQLPVIRVERRYPERTTDIVWCDDYEDAVNRLNADGITNLLALTGVQTMAKLRGYWRDRHKHRCWFRILQREESLALAKREGFDESHLVYYEQETVEELLKRLKPDAILTKESGESGGFIQKVEAAHRFGIPVYAVKRPELPKEFIVVTGENGLRKQIERHVPGFFQLRTGFTTGACATAASKAALLALLGEKVIDNVSITFPNGELLELPIFNITLNSSIATGTSMTGATTATAAETTATTKTAAIATTETETTTKTAASAATATVIKDAGDDPDITNGSAIVSTVKFSSTPGIHFLQGEGVGIITLPGLGLEIGEPAINSTPRKMITEELSSLYSGGLDVTISVPGGRELAKRTFNPRLGIEDGISIIGTSGIVRPFSSKAFVDAIRREAEVCKAVGSPRLVINSGAKSEHYLKAIYPNLPPQAFIHYGNFIGETLKIADELGFKDVTIGVMIGKAVKLAEGHLDTHSREVVMNKLFLKELAENAGCSQSALDTIEKITLTRELWDSFLPDDYGKFFRLLASRCHSVAQKCLPNGTLTLFLIDETGKCIEA